MTPLNIDIYLHGEENEFISQYTSTDMLISLTF